MSSLSFCIVSLAVLAGPPSTKKIPVVDVYHGTHVTDPYRWLEDWDNPQVRLWSDAQDAYARSILDALPNVPAIRKRVTEIMSAETVSYGGLAYCKGQYYVIKRQPPKQQPFLVVLDSLDNLDQARVLVDPNELDRAGTTSIDWFEPAPNGKLVAVSLSKAGSEIGDVHVYDVATGRQAYEVVPRVNGGTAGGDLVWAGDSSGFYYTRYPRGGERPEADLSFYQQAYFHTLGTSTDQDRYELGRDLPRIAEIEFELHQPSDTLLVTVQNGDGGEFAHYLRDADGSWRQFSYFGDQIIQATFTPEGDLLLITRDHAPRGKIVHLSRKTLDLKNSHEIIPESAATVVTSFYREPPSLVVTENRIYVLYQLGGPSEIRAFDRQGNRVADPDQLPVSDTGGMVTAEADQLLFTCTSYTEPPAYYRFDPAESTTTKTPLASDSPVSFDDVTVAREFATSQDGTKVPVNIIMPRGTRLDGSNPLILNGYGGYSVNITPGFSPARKVLSENGVIYAVANLRGGGEFGEAWHRAGNLTNKQNVFDDFAAVANYLMKRGYTSSARLAIIGGSNGGLLMGATLTQHPELMRAVVSYVGIYDMLRVELSPNGSFNIPEFGTVTNPDHFRAMYAYSPYHRVRDGVAYPATLFLTGANDPRVDPMQSRKMTARLQAATSSNEPILLRTSSSSGHGGDTALAERIEQTVDVYAFLLDKLGVSKTAD